MPKTPFFCQSVGMQDLSDEDEPIEPSRSAGERGRRGRIQHRANGEWRMAATRSSWEVSLSTMYAVTFRSTWMCIQQEAYDCWRPWQSWCEKYACVNYDTYFLVRICLVESANNVILFDQCRGRAGKVGPLCHSIPGMQCSKNNGSSIYRPFRGHNLTSYLFLWRERKTSLYITVNVVHGAIGHS